MGVLRQLQRRDPHGRLLLGRAGLRHGRGQDLLRAVLGLEPGVHAAEEQLPVGAAVAQRAARGPPRADADPRPLGHDLGGRLTLPGGR